MRMYITNVIVDCTNHSYCRSKEHLHLLQTLQHPVLTRIPEGILLRTFLQLCVGHCLPGN